MTCRGHKSIHPETCAGCLRYNPQALDLACITPSIAETGGKWMDCQSYEPEPQMLADWIARIPF